MPKEAVIGLVLFACLAYSLIAWAKNTGEYRPNYFFREGAGDASHPSAVVIIVFLLIVLALTKVFNLRLNAFVFGALFVSTLLIGFAINKSYYAKKKVLYDQEQSKDKSNTAKKL